MAVKKERDYLAIAEQYALDVVKGTIPAGKFAILAAKRFREDLRVSRLKRVPKRFPWRMDAERVSDAARFIERMPHVKGEWARRRQRIVLEPPQIFILANLFGWVHKDTRLRRFQYAYIEIPRKTAKSTLAAGIGLYMAFAEGEAGAEVYSAATSERQAREVFDTAKGMVDSLPALRRRGVVPYQSLIVHPKTRSRFEPLPQRPRDGQNPSCVIIDEYHEWKSAALYDALIGGMTARSQPLALIITTAGLSIDSPCYRHRQDVIQILEGTVTDDRVFVAIWGADADDDWTSDETLRKAHPMLGVTASEENILAIRNKALRDPQAEYNYKTKYLNIWVKSRSGLFDSTTWLDLADPNLTLDSLPKGTWYLGADLASKQDLTALVAVADIEGTLYVWSHFYLPERAVEEQAHRIPYAEYAALGHLTITPGTITDYDYLQRDIERIAKRLRTRKIVFDPFNATALMLSLRKRNLQVVELRTTMDNMTEPIEALSARIADRSIVHSSNPILDAHIASVEGHYGQSDRVKPARPSKAVKIDGVIGLLNGLSRILVEPKRDPSDFRIIVL